MKSAETRCTAAILLFAAALFFASQLNFWTLRLSGDEPHIAVTTISLLRGRLNMFSTYEEKDYRAAGIENLNPQIPPIKGFIPPEHGIGFPALIAPAFAIAGLIGAKLFGLTLAFLTLPLMFSNCIEFGLQKTAAALATLALVCAEPWEVHAALLFPEATAGLLTMAIIAAYLRFERTKSQGSAFLIGLFTILLPILYLKYATLAVASGALWLGNRDLRGRMALYASAPIAIAFALLWLYVYGPSISQGTGASPTEFSIWNLWPHYFYALIDRQHGLLTWAPVAMLAFGGLIVWQRSAPVAQAYLVSLIVLYTLLYGETVFKPGESLPGRYLVAVLPAMIVLAAITWLRAERPLRWQRVGVFCAFTVLTGAILSDAMWLGPTHLPTKYAWVFPILYYAN